MGRPAGQRGVDPEVPRNNRFRRLVTLCGLSAAEVASYLELSLSGVEQKMLGKRGISVEEEIVLARLWQRISLGTLDGAEPGGADRQAQAVIEAAAIIAGRDEE